MGLAAGSLIQAVRVMPWGAGATVSVTGTSSSATDLTGSKGQGVMFKCDVPFHMIWGASTVAAAQTTDLQLDANVIYRIDIPSPATDWGYFRVIRGGSTSGTLYYATIAY